MRCSLASMRRVAIGSLAAIILASTNAAAEPKYCGNGLWYPDGVCPTVQMIPPQPQGPTKEQQEQEQLRQQQIRNEQLRQQQIRNEQLRQEAFTKAEGAGISAYRRGDYQAAIEYFERALEHSPYNPVIKHDIERAREKLAEKNASRLSAGSSRAFDQLSAIANNSRAAVQAPRSHYSADIGGTGAPNQARGGFDSAMATKSSRLIAWNLGRKARLKVGTRTAAAGISSMKCISVRMRARTTGSSGVKLASGSTSSRYSVITVESVTMAPSWSSVGTTPFGLSLR